jgi:hypothetical protein
MSKLFDDLLVLHKSITELKLQSRDNLFSANHRNAMIEQYNYTDAMIATVGELMGQGKA